MTVNQSRNYQRGMPVPNGHSKWTYPEKVAYERGFKGAVKLFAEMDKNKLEKELKVWSAIFEL